MKRILLSAAILLAAGAFLVITGGASNGSAGNSTYKIELDNAFGLVTGAELKVAGVRAGTIESIGLDQQTLHAVVTVAVTQNGLASFRSDAFCRSRPESLIGEYFIDCDPGQSGKVLRPGSTILVTHTQSTIPADLLQNVMRMPYRQRFTLIINELGAAVAGRSEDLRAALRRAVPALTETDSLLKLLAGDSSTLAQLTTNSDSVITALSDNKVQVRRFIKEANASATATAVQQRNLRATFQKLPGFLEQLRPALAQLGAASAANQPVVANLNAASGQLNRLFTDLPGFAHSSLPAIRSLGHASITGKAAVNAAGPAVQNLNQFAQLAPELAKNLSIVLPALDSRSRAAEKDPRSPGGKGYTGLEALLQYVFNQTLALNTYGPHGHVLTSDAFLDPQCSFYASPATVALNLAKYGSSYRRCYSWLGPNQPGVNVPDPSNPKACVPDPGGAPPGEPGPRTTACKLTAAAAAKLIASAPLAGTTPTTSGYV
ncbi:MAG: MlaD family protein, partial [Actinomycetota bacterium]|nr:MlaD family protein [Actinomycetota bacterium]